mmetsp:Transcript_52683/g.104651  ORF Transcript_52683/g.104651 Transcript_52683/m.104651 type:complete len:226 (-) Transcript_52683:122-799(-)
MASVTPQVAIEAARAALIALHAATGLSADMSARTATRALRAAEGLTRTAISVLTATSTTPASKPSAPGDAGTAAATSHSHGATTVAAKRPRRKRRTKKKKEAGEKQQPDKMSDAPPGEGIVHMVTGSLGPGNKAATGGNAASAADTAGVAERPTKQHRVEEKLVPAPLADAAPPGPEVSTGSLVSALRKLARDYETMPKVNARVVVRTLRAMADKYTTALQLEPG